MKLLPIAIAPYGMPIICRHAYLKSFYPLNYYYYHHRSEEIYTVHRIETIITLQERDTH